MDFSKINPDKIIHKENQDYDLELWWYGFKNLVANLFKTNKNLLEYTKLFSNKLDDHQNKKNYQEIYNEIHNYVLMILKLFFTTAKTMQSLYFTQSSQSSYGAKLIITWLKRYNYIVYVQKIKLPDNYTDVCILELNNKDLTVLKFYIKYFELKYNSSMDLVKLFENNIFEFIDHCINNKYEGLINILSMKYNLEKYYKYKNLNIKYMPIMARKMIYLIKK